MSNSSEDFDPLHKWLGIPRQQQPPNLYQLLAIHPEEQDLETIETAYDQRSKLVIEQRGKGLENEVNAVLFQLQEAKITLMDPARRAEYDKKLQRLEHQHNRELQEEKPSREEHPLEYQKLLDERRSIFRGDNIDTGIVKLFAGLFSVLAVGMGAMFCWANQYEDDPSKTGKQAIVEAAEGKQGIGDGPVAEIDKENLEPIATAETAEVSTESIFNRPMVTRLELFVDADGSGMVSVKQVADEYELPQITRTISLPTLPLSKFYQLPNRRILSIHDFVETDPVETIFAYQALNAKKLLGQPVIEMTPKPEEGFDVGRVSQLMYGRSVKLPLRVTCDLSRFDGAGYGIKLYDPQKQWGLIQFKLWGKQWERQVSWVKRDETDEQTYENLVDDKKPFDLKEGVSHQFQLPVNESRITQLLVVDLSAFQVNAEAPQLTTHVRRVVFEGDLRPSFGFGMESQGNQLVVTSIFPDSSAEKAGMQSGDVLRRIDRVTPSSLSNALQMLQKSTMGDVVNLEVLREGNPLTLKLIGG